MTDESGYYDDRKVEIHKQAQHLLELCECNAAQEHHIVVSGEYLGTLPATFREQVLETFEELLTEIHQLRSR